VQLAGRLLAEEPSSIIQAAQQGFRFSDRDKLVDALPLQRESPHVILSSYQ
jgi:hypothetical protein